MAASPHLDLERSFWDAGIHLVCGMDEVGRGAWAGPVTIGAAVLAPCDLPVDGPLARVRDSKMLTPKVRSELLPHVRSWVVACAVGEATAQEVDRFGMTASLRLCGERALASLAAQGVTPGRVLLDGPHDYLSRPDLVTTLVKGDATSLAIAAASIVAKVHRDGWMKGLSVTYPGYGFERNAGYGSPAHRQALKDLGATDEHRRSWAFMQGISQEQMTIEDA